MSGRFKHTIFKRLQTFRNLQRRVSGTSHQYVSDGQERIEYEVNIDMDAIHAMAKKAAGNIGQFSIDGPIQVRTLLRERVS